MKQISIDQLQANQFYWARRKASAEALLSDSSDMEIIKVSTVFGTAQEFWTVAVAGSEEHFDLEAFEYLHKVPSPPVADVGRPNLYVSTAKSVVAYR